MVRCCGLFIEPISSEPYIIPAAMWAVKNDRSYKKPLGRSLRAGDPHP